MKKYIPLAEAALTTALLIIISIYALAYGWSYNGFTSTAVMWLSLLPGFLAFGASLVVLSYKLAQYRRTSMSQEEAPVSGWWLWLGTTAGTLLCLFAIDALVYYAVDTSLSSDFAAALGSLTVQAEATMEAFAKLPFLVQNFVGIVVAVLLGSGLAVLTARRLAPSPSLHLG